MQILNISKTNFGKLYVRDTAIQNGLDYTNQDRRQLRGILYALNDNVAQDISAYAEVGRPAATGFRKSIRIQTSPTTQDMAVIKAFRPQAQRVDYKRRSHWVRLYDKDVYEKLAEFIFKQKGYIHHCTIDPHHIARPCGKPMWNPGTYHRELTPREVWDEV